MSETPEADGTAWEYSTPARKAAWSACLPFQVSPADLLAGTVPAGRSAGETWKGKHADQAAFLAGVEYSQAVPSMSGVSDIIANFDNELPGLAAGDPASILGGAQVNLQAILS